MLQYKSVEKMNRGERDHNQFFKDMIEVNGRSVEFYSGRNFWTGPAIQCDESDLQDIIRLTSVPLQWDTMGKNGLIVYPARYRYDNAVGDSVKLLADICDMIDTNGALIPEGSILQITKVLSPAYFQYECLTSDGKSVQISAECEDQFETFSRADDKIDPFEYCEPRAVTVE